MKPLVRNTLLSMSIAAALAGLILTFAPAHTPQTAHTPTQSKQNQSVKRKTALHTHDHREHLSEKTEEHDHSAHANIDMSEGFNPSMVKNKAEPKGLSDDDRDEFMVQLANAESRREKRTAISKLSREITSNQETIDLFHQTLKRETDEKIQVMLVRALSKTQDPKLVPTLEYMALNSTSPLLQSRALLALASFPEATSFPSILDIAENARSPIRERAVRLLGKQFPQEPETETLLAELN